VERRGALHYKDGVLRLTAENVTQLVKDPGLYVACPCLMPLKAPAARFHAQLPKGGCSKCLKNKIIPTLNKIADAFVITAKACGDTSSVKAHIGKLSNLAVQDLEVTYNKDGKIITVRL